MVKDNSKAEFTFKIASNGEEPIAIIKEPKDINVQYPFNQNKAIEKINSIFKKKDIEIKLNAYQYQQLCKYFKLYDNLEFCYPVLIDKVPRKLFSMNIVNFLVSNLETNPNIIKTAICENKKKIDPRSKGILKINNDLYSYIGTQLISFTSQSIQL